MRCAFSTLLALSCAGVCLAAQAPAPDHTLLLLVEGDVDGVAVTKAWRKAFRLQEFREADDPKGWIRVLDTAGRQLARVPLDLTTVNLDRGATKGRPVLVGEDRVLEGTISLLAKIPDFGDRAARVEIDVVEDGVARTIGRASGVELRRLASRAGPNAALTKKTHLNNGPVGNRYDIVVIGDGYRSTEVAKFQGDVDRWIANLFAKEPFKTYKAFFNVHSVHNPSLESGADHPDRNPPIVKNTIYDATYNYGGTGRCLYIRNFTQARTDAAAAPDVEGRIVVFVNDSRYGGCAGSFAVSYNGSSGAEVQSHEFGHSYGGLADEYDYGRSGTYSGPEPPAANITASSSCAKWSLWRGFNGIGCFQGAGYYKTGLWRPKSNCLMRALNVPLCEICVEEMTKDGYTTVNPIENPSPSSTTVTLTRPAQQAFRFTNLVPSASTPQVRWLVDNALRQTGSTSFVLQSASLAAGIHTLKLEVTDRTARVRKDPTNKLVRTRVWTVNVRDGGATYTTFGTGCRGTGGVPALTNTGLPRLGNSFSVNLTSARANAVSLLWLGRRTSIPLPPSLAPGCTAYALADVLLAARQASGSGAASVQVGIPNAAGLSGVKFSNQWYVLDSGANNLGMVLSNGGEATIGG